MRRFLLFLLSLLSPGLPSTIQSPVPNQQLLSRCTGSTEQHTDSRRELDQQQIGRASWDSEYLGQQQQQQTASAHRHADSQPGTVLHEQLDHLSASSIPGLSDQPRGSSNPSITAQPQHAASKQSHGQQNQAGPQLLPYLGPQIEQVHMPFFIPAEEQYGRFGAPDRPGWKWHAYTNHPHPVSWGIWAADAVRAVKRQSTKLVKDCSEWVDIPFHRGRRRQDPLQHEQHDGDHALQSMLAKRLADEPMTDFNDSSLVPLLPYPVAWLLEDAEEELANVTRLPTQLLRARTLATHVSVSYCSHSAIRAWNCSSHLSLNDMSAEKLQKTQHFAPACWPHVYPPAIPSDCSHLAIWAWSCSGCNGKMRGFEVEDMTFDAQWDLAGYAGFSPYLDAMVVAFRGTDSHSISNWAENMRYWRTDLHLPYPGAEGALVHTGFFLSYNGSNLAPNITVAVRNMMERHPGKPLYVAGHSMGGALATLCAIDLKFTLGLSDVRVYTYGSPRVGNDIFARFFAANIQESIRVTHNRDIVPAWPPELVGFHHVAREVWVIDVANVGVIGICDDSGEDPRCHNSVCYLGFCTSVHDHLHYMGAGMFHRGGTC